MTKDPPLYAILDFMVPNMLGLIFYQLYGMVDTMIVGQCLGVKALAAVGSTSSVNYMIMGFCMGVCNGFVVPVSQKFGARDYRALRRLVVNSVWLGAGLSVLVTGVVCGMCMQILIWMRTPADIMQDAYDYILLIFLGIPLTFCGNISGGIIRSLGDSRTPLYFSVASSVLNVGLDYFAIQGLHMGVRGAALATLCAQMFSCVLNLTYIRRQSGSLWKGGPDSGWDWKPDGYTMRVLCGMGIPMGLQHSITAVGSIVIQTAVNTLGSVFVAAVTAANRVISLATIPFDSLASTMTVYAGQNIGAKKLSRIQKGVRMSMGIGSVYAAAALGILFFGGRHLAMLFVEAEEETILGAAHQFLIGNGIFFLLLLMVDIFRLTIQGMGHTGLAMFAGVCEMLARTAVAFLVVPIWGYQGICLANPIAWLCAVLFLVPMYGIVLKKERKEISNVTTGYDKAGRDYVSGGSGSKAQKGSGTG